MEADYLNSMEVTQEQDAPVILGQESYDSQEKSKGSHPLHKVYTPTGKPFDPTYSAFKKKDPEEERRKQLELNNNHSKCLKITLALMKRMQ